MTPAERLFAVILAVGLALAIAFDPPVVETLLAIQVILLGGAAIIAGGYIAWITNGRDLRAVSLYLWLLVRRDKRIALALGGLAAFAAATLTPRLLAAYGIVSDGTIWISRPWGAFIIVCAIDLLAIGLLDDAIQMRIDGNADDPTAKG